MTLSTHVLDTAVGIPAAGVALTLERDGVTLFLGQTDPDGRCPALREVAVDAGRYRLTFAIAAYFRARGVALADPPFLEDVTIAFGIADAAAHYHVPLLVSPFAYSTYRGS